MTISFFLKNFWSTDNFITFSFQTLQREVRKLLAEGKIATYEKGEIVVRLIEQEDVIEEEALIAASRCNDVESAIELLAQECQLCMNVMKMTEVRI